MSDKAGTIRCPQCDGEGVLHTGIAEASTVICNFCNGQERVPSERADSAPIQAHSKTEYKRLTAQGANVVPPEASPTQAGETPRDCAHGQLARSCRICELERENAALQARLDAIPEFHVSMADYTKAVGDLNRQLAEQTRLRQMADHERDGMLEKLLEARANERERCAKVADSLTYGPCGQYDYGYSDASAKADERASQIADEIRALTDEAQP